MRLTDSELKELGYMFIKNWKQDSTLNGMIAVMDALRIPWRLNTGKHSLIDSVTIQDKTFKFEEVNNGKEKEVHARKRHS